MKIKRVINPSYSYHKNKERLQKEAHERYQNLSEEEKEKRDDIVANNIKIFLEIKSFMQYLLKKAFWKIDYDE